ncbi:MAG TPA: HAMP domain-containing sensor histidine kinase [bacterium]|nr:HAMP domain-containing sensor histidine kinase [bacterium]
MKDKTSYIKQLAHDIRSPLATLQMAAGDVQMTLAGNDELSDSLTLINLSVNRLMGMAENLLCRLCDQTILEQSIDVHEVIDKLMAEYGHTKQLWQITFTNQYFDSSLKVSGAPERLMQALGNIIQNAIEAMNYCGEIFITTMKKDGQVVIIIKDTGPGMSDQIKRNIFTEGYTTKKEGHGIGLGVVSNVINELNGTVKVFSKPGQGCIFHLTLPLAGASPEADASIETIDLPKTVMCPLTNKSGERWIKESL